MNCALYTHGTEELYTLHQRPGNEYLPLKHEGRIATREKTKCWNRLYGAVANTKKTQVPELTWISGKSESAIDKIPSRIKQFRTRLYIYRTFKLLDCTGAYVTSTRAFLDSSTLQDQRFKMVGLLVVSPVSG